MDVFVSYSHKDQELADELCALLSKNGFSYWIASEHARHGVPFSGSITNAIDQTSMTLLVLSEHANSSSHVLNEVNYAFAHGKKVLPVVVGQVTLTKDLEYYFGPENLLPYSQSPQFTADLLAIIRDILQEGPAPARPTVVSGDSYIAPKKIPWWVWTIPAGLVAIILIALLVSSRVSSDQFSDAQHKEIEKFGLMSESEQENATYYMTVGDVQLVDHVWTNCCSANTDVATFENHILTAIAPGETYISVGGAGMYKIFKVVVSDTAKAPADEPTQDPTENPFQEPTNAPTSEPAQDPTEPPSTDTNPEESDALYNQVPAEYASDLEEFLYTEKTGNSERVRVGEKKVPFLAQSWTYVASYSTDTRIATVDGKIVTGVSPGVAYVVLISSMGNVDIYEIVVSP